MLKNPSVRRPIALFLILLGGALMFLAPETWGGLVVLAIGVFVELIGIALSHRHSSKL